VGLVERNLLVAKLSPPFDHLLATQLVDEFVSQERRYIQRDWEPSELDGGQFCEILGRIVYHQDSGNLNRDRKFDECASYIENDHVTHAITPRVTALNLIKVLRTVYKFRSVRGAVHISSTYRANHMDARMMIENVRWAMNETLRVFWQGDREAVSMPKRNCWCCCTMRARLASPVRNLASTLGGRHPPSRAPFKNSKVLTAVRLSCSQADAIGSRISAQGGSESTWRTSCCYSSPGALCTDAGRTREKDRTWAVRMYLWETPTGFIRH
jgi:hypothetical protein